MEVGIMLYIDCPANVYEQARTLKDIGVNHTFINARHPEIDRVLEFIKSEGLICDTLHSGFGGEYNGIKFDHQDLCNAGIKGDLMRDLLCKNIDICAKHSVPVIVIHDPHDTPTMTIA